MDVAVALDFGGKLDEHIHSCRHATKTVLCSNCALNWLLLAVSDDDQQIQITPRLRLPPGIRAKKIDRLRVEFVDQAMGDLFLEGK